MRDHLLHALHALHHRYTIAVVCFLYALGNVIAEAAGIVSAWYASLSHWSNLVILSCALFVAMRSRATNAHVFSEQEERACRPPTKDRQRLEDSQSGSQRHDQPTADAIARHFAERHISHPAI